MRIVERLREWRVARAYKALFQGADGTLNPAARTVLADLRWHCCAYRPVHVPGDPYSTAYQDGRREVFLRIVAFLGLEEDTLTVVTEDDYGG